MTGASIEETLELWASSLREVKGRMRPLFSQERVAASANSFLDGLLGDERRKTGWMRAEAAGDAGPWRQQAILGRGRWDADALRDVVRQIADGSTRRGGRLLAPFGIRYVVVPVLDGVTSTASDKTPLPAGLVEDDRRLARSLLTAAREAGIVCHPVHVADDLRLLPVTPDDLAA